MAGTLNAIDLFEAARRAILANDRTAGLDLIEQGLLLAPGNAAAWLERGSLLFEKRQLFESLLSFSRAAALTPTDARPLNGCGVCLQMLRHYERAGQSYERALTLDPNSADAAANYAMMLRPTNPERSITLYHTAIAARPEEANFHFGLAESLLRLGHYEEGWKEYDWRRMLPSYDGGHLDLPTWDGSPAPGKTILLYGEQGFGDAIQFVRYARLVRRAIEKVVVEVRVPLVRLFSYALNRYGIEVVARGSGTKADLGCSLLSLPLLFRTHSEAAIPRGRYLATDPAMVAPWHKRLSNLPPGRRVGLCWAGAARENQWQAHEINSRRSMALADLAPLAECCVSFVSLQLGPEAQEAFDPPAGMVIGAWPKEIGDFADTAALIDGLDLVITVDTAIAHLAAAMGKPTWLLSRFDNCWRWLGDRTDSPWYPTVRQFRQQAWCEWEPIIEEVAEALRLEASAIAARRHLAVTED